MRRITLSEEAELAVSDVRDVPACGYLKVGSGCVLLNQPSALNDTPIVNLTPAPRQSVRSSCTANYSNQEKVISSIAFRETTSKQWKNLVH